MQGKNEHQYKIAEIKVLEQSEWKVVSKSVTNQKGMPKILPEAVAITRLPKP